MNRAWAVSLVFLQAAAGCASPKHVDAASPTPIDALATIGATDDGDETPADAFVREHADAAAIAADALLHETSEVRLKGARRVVFAIPENGDLSALDRVSVARAGNEPCRVTDLVQLFGVAPVIKDGSAPARFEPAYARLLARVGDQTWPTCVKTCPTCETSRRRPEQVVTEILVEMTPVRPAPPFLRDPSDESTPEEEAAFRRWWKAHRAELVRERGP